MFVELVSSTSKKELESKCKSIKITSEDFTDFIIFCKTGLCHLEHRMQFFDFVPKHLETKPGDWHVLHISAEERATKKNQTLIRKLFKAHGQRKYIVGHMFLERNFKSSSEWHFVFFEANELIDRGNHWAEGSHVHLVNHLWPNMDANKVWLDFIHKCKLPNSKLHIRFCNSE